MCLDLIFFHWIKLPYLEELALPGYFTYTTELSNKINGEKVSYKLRSAEIIKICIKVSI